MNIKELEGKLLLYDTRINKLKKSRDKLYQEYMAAKESIKKQAFIDELRRQQRFATPCWGAEAAAELIEAYLKAKPL